MLELLNMRIAMYGGFSMMFVNDVQMEMSSERMVQTRDSLPTNPLHEEIHIVDLCYTHKDFL